MEEEALLIRLTAGNERDANAAYNRLDAIVRPRLFGYLAKLTKSTAEREDVAQETLCKLWEVRSRFRYLGIERFYAWVYLTAKRRIYDIRRSEVNIEEIPEQGDWHSLKDLGDHDAILHCSNILWLE